MEEVEMFWKHRRRADVLEARIQVLRLRLEEEKDATAGVESALALERAGHAESREDYKVLRLRLEEEKDARAKLRGRYDEAVKDAENLAGENADMDRDLQRIRGLLGERYTSCGALRLAIEEGVRTKDLCIPSGSDLRYTVGDVERAVERIRRREEGEV